MSNSHTGSTLQINNLGVTFSSKANTQQIFHNLNLEIKSGEIISVCGLSGIGKSTFLRVLAGLRTPSQGFVTINHERFNKPFEGMSYVSQDYSRSLFPWLTVEKNVSLPFRGKKLESKLVRDRVNEVLEAVGLLLKNNSYPRQLSGGMQQRVVIARAIVTKPRLLLLDEPFASVDSNTRLDLEDLVLTLAGEIGATTVLVTHDIDEAIYMSDRVLVMTGNPAQFTKEINIQLKRPRNQTSTRSQPLFVNLRDSLYKSVRK